MHTEGAEPTSQQATGKDRRRSYSKVEAPSEESNTSRHRKLSLDSSMAPISLNVVAKEAIGTPAAMGPETWRPYANANLSPHPSTGGTQNSVPPPVSLIRGEQGDSSADDERYGRPLQPRRVGKNEKKRIIKLGECFQRAMKPLDDKDSHHGDPLAGIPIKIALDVYTRNLPFFNAQKIFDGLGDFLDRVSTRALMDSSDDLVRMPRKRGVPSTTSSDPFDEVHPGTMRQTRSSKRINDQNSPKKKVGDEIRAPPSKTIQREEKLTESGSQDINSVRPIVYEDDKDQIPSGQPLPKEFWKDNECESPGLQCDQPSSA